jgi:hypothetical protein
MQRILDRFRCSHIHEHNCLEFTSRFYLLRIRAAMRALIVCLLVATVLSSAFAQLPSDMHKRLNYEKERPKLKGRRMGHFSRYPLIDCSACTAVATEIRRHQNISDIENIADDTTAFWNRVCSDVVKRVRFAKAPNGVRMFTHDHAGFPEIAPLYTHEDKIYLSPDPIRQLGEYCRDIATIRPKLVAWIVAKRFDDNELVGKFCVAGLDACNMASKDEALEQEWTRFASWKEQATKSTAGDLRDDDGSL